MTSSTKKPNQRPSIQTTVNAPDRKQGSKKLRLGLAGSGKDCGSAAKDALDKQLAAIAGGIANLEAIISIVEQITSTASEAESPSL